MNIRRNEWPESSRRYLLIVSYSKCLRHSRESLKKFKFFDSNTSRFGLHLTPKKCWPTSKGQWLRNIFFCCFEIGIFIIFFFFFNLKRILIVFYLFVCQILKMQPLRKKKLSSRNGARILSQQVLIEECKVKVIV